MFLTTDYLDPDRQNTILNLDRVVLNILPKDYLSFLNEYGPGTYCNEVYITYPDSRNIPLTFKDNTDLWELHDEYNETDLLESVQIGSTANGDIICVTQNRKDKIFVLPRHSMEVASFKSFNDCIQALIPKDSEKYFDPLFDSRYEQISLIQSSKEQIDIFPIHEQFLQKFSFDMVINGTTQPKYFFRNFGGWITFDLIYKNGIYIKFQTRYSDNVSTVLDFLKNHLQ
ncbi:MAG: hypothetical protein LBE92_17170 [Chryseobacterium sp.]|jgi:hypothetical protein|uniref:hypothetical protein n=1 Tax=Chryseobacterium sp. TaxID=1871047 RepID=UPI002827F9B7|nr:hypothetical protein [Chryseobacterium sp.]MDR2237857.1 hypothetical protein [Chryseobacterium sp.]